MLTDTQSDSPRLIRNSIFLLGIEIVTKLLGLIFFIFLARFLGAGELGLYAYAVTLANFFVLVPKFGFESLVQREVGRNHASAWQYFRALSTLKGILALLSLLALTGVAVFTLSPEEGQTVLLVGCFVFTYSFLEFVDAFFRALERAEFEVLVRLWFSLANLTIGFYLLYSGRGLKAVVMGQLVSVLTAVVIALVILHRVVLLVSNRLSAKGLWLYFINATPFAGIVAALFFSNQMGILIVSFFTHKTEVGYLAAGLRLFDNLTLIPAALMGAFLPVVSRYYRTSIGAFTTTVRLTLKYLFVFSAPLAVGMFCLSPQITVFLFKDAFLPTARCSTNSQSGADIQLLELSRRQCPDCPQSRDQIAPPGLVGGRNPRRNQPCLNPALFLSWRLLGNITDPGLLFCYFIRLYAPLSKYLRPHSPDLAANSCRCGYGTGSFGAAKLTHCHRYSGRHDNICPNAPSDKNSDNQRVTKSQGSLASSPRKTATRRFSLMSA